MPKSPKSKKYVQVLVLTGILLVSLGTLSLGILLSQRGDISPRKESALSPTVVYNVAATATPTHTLTPTPRPTTSAKPKFSPTVTFLPADTSAPTPEFTPTIGPSKAPATATPTPTSGTAIINSGETPSGGNPFANNASSTSGTPSPLAIILISAGCLMSAVSLLLLMLAIRKRHEQEESKPA